MVQSEKLEITCTASSFCGFPCAWACRGAEQLWGELISVGIPSKCARTFCRDSRKSRGGEADRRGLISLVLSSSKEESTRNWPFAEGAYM
jgi:hypothetical protein